ncbi:MAG: hypothetical protein ABR518_05070, partial [Actinomycetota bacterium]
MARRALVAALSFVTLFALAPSAHAGPVTGKVKKSGKVTYYFVPGSAGTGIPWPEGGELDAPGDLAGLSSKRGNEPHVALANVWTTVFLELPLTFESAPFPGSTMVGGNVA